MSYSRSKETTKSTSESNTEEVEKGINMPYHTGKHKKPKKNGKKKRGGSKIKMRVHHGC